MGTPYEEPTVTKLTPEETRLKLVLLAHASRGDQCAKDFLENIFPDSDPTRRKHQHDTADFIVTFVPSTERRVFVDKVLLLGHPRDALFS
jgi:hypothetical protein